MSWRQEARGHALNSSLNHSLPLTPSLTLFVAPLLPHSLTRVASLSDFTLTLSLTSSLSHSFTLSPTHSLSHYVHPFHTHSLTHSISHSPQCMPPAPSDDSGAPAHAMPGLQH